MQLIVDWHRALANIDVFHDRVTTSSQRIRPHVKGHRLTAITREQILRGATGIVAQTMAEAVHHAAANQLTDVVIARPTTEPWRLARYLDGQHRLEAHGTRLIVQLSDAQELQELVHLCGRTGSRVDVRLELDSGLGRGLTHQGLVRAAHLVHHTPGLALQGISTYCLPASREQAGEWSMLSRDSASQLLRVADSIRADRLECPVVSMGGTVNAGHIADVPGIDEIAAGAYVFADADTARRVGLEPALRIRATRQELFRATRAGGLLADCAQEWAPTTWYSVRSRRHGVVEVAPTHLCPILVHDVRISVRTGPHRRTVRPEIFPDRP